MKRYNLYLCKSTNIAQFKIDNIEHLLHDTLVNILFISKNVVTKTLHGGLEILPKKNSSTGLEVILINKIHTRYTLFGIIVEYSFLCAITRGNNILDISINEDKAELVHVLMDPEYIIYVMPDHNKENILSKISFDNIYNFQIWNGVTECNYYVIVWYNYNLRYAFIKDIESFIIKDSSSLYISSDKKCVFINCRKPISSSSGIKVISYPERIYNKHVMANLISGLPEISIYLENSKYLPSIKNVVYPRIRINEGNNFNIKINKEYLHADFFKYLAYILGASFIKINIKIRIYAFNEDFSNIHSMLKSEIDRSDISETDTFIYFYNDFTDTDFYLFDNYPIAFIMTR